MYGRNLCGWVALLDVLKEKLGLTYITDGLIVGFISLLLHINQTKWDMI